jgi:peroxiredoxin
MVMVSSTMLPLGTRAPAFRLPDTEGKQVSLDDFPGAKGYLVIFLCNHCPFVKHVREGLSKAAKEYQAKGLAVVGISSNDVAAYPDDSPAKMKEEARNAGYTFPYLYDESQEVAKAYRAACTPDFFLFDGGRQLYYRGQFDASRPGNDKPVTGADLGAAVDALLTGKPPPERQYPSAGCNIKWKPGNAPEYF